MWQQLILAFIGLSAGTIIAGGVVGLLIGLSITPRYAGITHTSDKMLLYEDVTLLGALFGNTFYLYKLSLPLGWPFLIILGLFSGIFLGGWILALAEMADVFPIFSRRIRFSEGLPKVFLCIALGKLAGSFFFFYKGWQ